MKSIVLALLLGVLTPALGWAQATAGLNTITGVTVNGTTVEITGTQKPNFTTFTMTEPPRLVIDISEAVLSGVKDAIAVDNGTITAIQTANYGSEEAAIARVLIIYSREVETDIQARGNSLMVNLSGGAGVAVAARTPAAPSPTPSPTTNPPATGTPASTQPTAPAVADTPPGKTVEQATVAAREDQQRQEADAEAARKAAQAEQKRQAEEAEAARKAAQAEQKRQELAEAEAKKAAQAQAEEERKAQARAEAERKAQEQAAKVAAEQAERQRLKQEREAQQAQAAAEKQRQQEEARTAAEEKKRLAAEEKQQRTAEEKARREAAAQAAAETRKQKQEEARAAAEEKKRLAAEERERQRAEAQAAAEQKQKPREAPRPPRVAQAELPPPVATQGEAAVSGRRKTMTLVGFKQESTGSRVFVRTNEPVRYTVSEANKTVVLELENTRIGDEKNARMLDTSYFDTAVALVDATYAGPSRSSVRVAIKLKQQVPYQTHQEGNVLSIEFGRPTPH